MKKRKIFKGKSTPEFNKDFRNLAKERFLVDLKKKKTTGQPRSMPDEFESLLLSTNCLKRLLQRTKVAILRIIFARHFPEDIVSQQNNKQAVVMALLERWYEGKSNLERRRDEIKNLEDFQAHEEFVKLCGVIVPGHLVMCIFNFLGHDKSLLFNFGSVNSTLYVLVLSSWKRLHIQARFLKTISLLVLRSVSEIRLGKRDQHENESVLKISDVGFCHVTKSAFPRSTSLAYFLKNINPTRLTRMSLVSWGNDLDNFFSKIRSDNIQFPNLLSLSFPVIPRKRVRSWWSRWDSDEDNHTKKKKKKKKKTRVHCFNAHFPRLQNLVFPKYLRIPKSKAEEEKNKEEENYTHPFLHESNVHRLVNLRSLVLCSLDLIESRQWIQESTILQIDSLKMFNAGKLVWKSPHSFGQKEEKKNLFKLRDFRNLKILHVEKGMFWTEDVGHLKYLEEVKVEFLPLDVFPFHCDAPLCSIVIVGNMPFSKFLHSRFLERLKIHYNNKKNKKHKSKNFKISLSYVEKKSPSAKNVINNTERVLQDDFLPFLMSDFGKWKLRVKKGSNHLLGRKMEISYTRFNGGVLKFCCLQGYGITWFSNSKKVAKKLKKENRRNGPKDEIGDVLVRGLIDFLGSGEDRECVKYVWYTDESERKSREKEEEENKQRMEGTRVWLNYKFDFDKKLVVNDDFSKIGTRVQKILNTGYREWQVFRRKSDCDPQIL